MFEESASTTASYGQKKSTSTPLFKGLAQSSSQKKYSEPQKPLLEDWFAKNSSTKKTTQKTYQKSTGKTYKAPTKTSNRIYGVRTTAYCHLENEPGAVGNLNAIGTALRWGPVRSAAADWSKYPLGTQFRIVGDPQIYEIDDYGSALVGNGTIDFYKPTLGAMHSWGLRYVDIEIVKWGCYHRSLSYLPATSGYWHVRQMHSHIKAKINKY